MPDIQIYVCCHKPSPVAEHPLLCPIQVGTALSDERINSWLYDDDGENISRENRSYCELTAQYWAWKNSKADYLGFFHYRRYLYPDINAKRPYIIRKSPDAELLEKLGYSEFSQLIEKNDIIVPLPEDMHLSVREYYASAPHHRREDLALMESIVREKQPDYIPAMEAYLADTKQYFGNMYVMKREFFRAYCEWLFPLLKEFDHHADWTNRTAQDLRVDGYLAERMLGIYITNCAPGTNIIYLPRVHFERDFLKRTKQCALNKMLPPGTKLRAIIKRIFRTH